MSVHHHHPPRFARVGAIAATLFALTTTSADPVVFQPGLVVKPFAGAAAGGADIMSPKFSVIDAVNGAHGGWMYVSQLGGADVVQIKPDGTVLPYTLPWGPFMSGAAGITIDGPTADLPAPTMALYGGPAAMFVAEVGAFGPINFVNPGGAWLPYSPPVSIPGSAGLVIDRTPAFTYGGLMYFSDWGRDQSDAVYAIMPGGFPVLFAPLPGLDPRYMTIDATGGATGYGPNALWVSSYKTGAVFSITPAGVAMPPLAILFPDLEGLAFGLGDAVFGTDLYAANLSLGTIDRIRPDGTVVPFAAGFQGAAYLQFVNTGPYARNGNPTLYVDDGNKSVWVIETVSPKKARVTFSIDYQGPPKGAPDARFQFPMTEGDILLSPTAFGGPAPEIFISAGMGPPGPGLALPMHPAAVGLPPGVPGHVEVDALSYGRDARLGVGTSDIPERIIWYFSVDEWAAGLPGSPMPPNIWTEGAMGSMEASADVFMDVPPIGPGPLPPGPFFLGNTDVYDGDGVAPPFPPLPGLALVEPNPPIPGVPDEGTNVDGLDVDTNTQEPWPVYFSLDSAYVFDFNEGTPGTASAIANGPFVGGDVLVSMAPGAVPAIYAPAFMLGLDLFGPDNDDLDALILWDNGNGYYDPPQGPYSWIDGSTNMLLFSVRRGSQVIGMPDFLWGAPIEPGDILLPPPGPFMMPGIWIPAETLGLSTQRWTGGPADDLDAADLMICLPCDTNCDGSVNGFDIEPFTALLEGSGQPCSMCSGDTNGDGSINGFDIQGFIGCLS